MNKTGSTQLILTLSEEDYATTTVNLHKTLEVLACGFQDMRADRQTNRYTNHNTSHLSHDKERSKQMQYHATNYQYSLVS